MATPAQMVATIKTTLESLYSKDVAALTDEGRSLHYAEVGRLEKSLALWEARAKADANASGTGGLGVSRVTLRGEN